MDNQVDHQAFMNQALELAKEAMNRGDWPAGAVVVKSGAVIGRGNNRQNTGNDLMLHAETEALRDAFQRQGTTDLRGTTLYASMEPCPMCAWAMRAAGISHLVLGARHADLKRTDLGSYSVDSFAQYAGFPLQLTQGVLHEQCLALRRAWGKDQTK